MDMYLSAQDGFNLQEMLDCDIKCEMDDSFGLDGDLPPLDLDDDSNNGWVQGNSNSSFELDFFNGDCTSSLMVNPSSIMPLSSMQIKKESDIDSDFRPVIIQSSITSLKKESPPGSPADKSVLRISPSPPTICTVLASGILKTDDHSNIRRVAVMGNGINSNLHQRQQSVSSVNNNTNINNIKIRKTPVPSRKQLSLNETICYPKPAYSYSCLIAMALKNSRSGSLPVSEIYNFMCDHFPYFKTAPNGWKNSVRHNLSLNKCFEKIEKPVSGPGGTQRKGCLWAMNPAKIAKMDDEVAKWSRRDPSAIKKAMLCPENLEMLERGELKVGRAHGDSEGEVDIEEEECNEVPATTQLVNGEEEEVEGEDGQEEEEDEEEEEEEEEEEDEEEQDDDEPQPIGSDESEDELSRMPPSLQPFEPRLALLNRHLNDSNLLSRLPNNLNDFSVEEIDEYNKGYEQLDVEESRAFLGLDVGSPKFMDDSDAEQSDVEDIINSRLHHRQIQQIKTLPAIIGGKKRKINSSSSSLIQGNYVCVKRKLTQPPSITCRSVN